MLKGIQTLNCHQSQSSFQTHRVSIQLFPPRFSKIQVRKLATVFCSGYEDAPKDKSREVLCAIWTCTRPQQVFLMHVLTGRSGLARPSKSSYNLNIRPIKTYISTITLCASAAPTLIYHQTWPGFSLLRFYGAIYWDLVLNNGRWEVRRGKG